MKECHFCLGDITGDCIAVDHFIHMKSATGEWLEPSGTTYFHNECVDDAKKDPTMVMSGGEDVMKVLERVARETN